MFGDIHQHTGASGDGGSSDLGVCTGECGALAEIGLRARAFGLDFLATTDHVNDDVSASVADFNKVLRRLKLEHDPEGGFVTIPGAELYMVERGTVHQFGHKTLLLFGEEEEGRVLNINQLRPYMDGGSAMTDCASIWSWMDSLQADVGPALLLAHHPAPTYPMSTDWDCHSETYAPVAEVYSEHGNSMGLGDGYDDPRSDIVEEGTIMSALGTYGLQLGFVAGSDNHDTKPGNTCRLDTQRDNQLYGGGLTIAVLREGEVMSRSTLFDAFVDRRVYASTGPMIPATVEVLSGDLSLGQMGELVAVPEQVDVTVEVRIPESMVPYVNEVWVHTAEERTLASTSQDGVWHQTWSSSAMPSWAFVEFVVDGQLWWAGFECDDGGEEWDERVWMSPNWFEVVSDYDDDGWTVAAGDCDDTNSAIGPDAQEDCELEGDENCNGLADGEDEDCAGDSGGGVLVDDTGLGGEPAVVLDEAKGPRARCSGHTGAAFIGCLTILGQGILRRRKIRK